MTLQNGEEPATIGNGTYLTNGDVLFKTIANRWGENIQVEVPTLQDTAKEIIRTVHNELGHLGTKAMLAALQTWANIPYAQDLVEQTLKTCDQCQFTQRKPIAMQPLHPIP